MQYAYPRSTSSPCAQQKQRQPSLFTLTCRPQADHTLSDLRLSSSALPNGITATMPCANAHQIPLSLLRQSFARHVVQRRGANASGNARAHAGRGAAGAPTSAYLVLPQQALKAARASVRDMPLMRSIVRLDMSTGHRPWPKFNTLNACFLRWKPHNKRISLFLRMLFVLRLR